MTISQALLEAWRLYGERGIHSTIINLPNYFGLPRALKDAAVTAKAKMDAEFVEMEMRKEIFDNLVKYRESLGSSDISGEHRKCLDRFILNGQRNGNITIKNGKI